MQDTPAQRLAPYRAIRLPRVCDHTGASPATVWRWAKDDPTFPKPFHLSKGVTCWDEAEVFDWIAAKKAQQRAGAF